MCVAFYIVLYDCVYGFVTYVGLLSCVCVVLCCVYVHSAVGVVSV